TGPRPLPPGDDVLRLGGGAGHVRDDRPDPRPAERPRPGTRLRALRAGVRHGDAGAGGPRGGPAVSRRASAAPRLLLSDEQAAGGSEELVRGPVRGARADDEGPRGRRPALRGGRHADHLGLDRLRRLGVGRRPLRRRSPRLQEARLRDALRRRQRLVCRVRAVLPRPAVLALRAPEVPRRRGPGAAQALNGYTGPLMTPTLRAHFADYAAFHGTAGNKACHYVGIPLIVLAMLALLARVPLFAAGGFTVTLAEVALVGVTAYYLTLDAILAVIMLAASVGLLMLGRPLPVWVSAALFVLGWIFQFIGHYVYEKRSPAFFRNLAHLLV